MKINIKKLEQHIDLVNSLISKLKEARDISDTLTSSIGQCIDLRAFINNEQGDD